MGRLGRRRSLHRRRQGDDQQQERRDDPRRDASPDREDHAARRDLVQRGRRPHSRSTTATRRFMRNWPYALLAQPGHRLGGQGQVRRARCCRTAAAARRSARSAAGSSASRKFSKHKDAAIELVRYLTSPAVQKFDAIFNSNVPTIPPVARISGVVKTNPYLTPAIANVARVTRPAKYLKSLTTTKARRTSTRDQPDPQRHAGKERRCRASPRS